MPIVKLSNILIFSSSDCNTRFLTKPYCVTSTQLHGGYDNGESEFFDLKSEVYAKSEPLQKTVCYVYWVNRPPFVCTVQL